MSLDHTTPHEWMSSLHLIQESQESLEVWAKISTSGGHHAPVAVCGKSLACCHRASMYSRRSSWCPAFCHIHIPSAALLILDPSPMSLSNTETPPWCSNRVQCAAVVAKSFGRCRPPAAHLAAALEPGCWRKLAQQLLLQKHYRISTTRKCQGYQEIIMQNFPE